MDQKTLFRFFHKKRQLYFDANELNLFLLLNYFITVVLFKNGNFCSPVHQLHIINFRELL